MTGATEIQCDLFEVKLKKWRQPAAHDNKMKMQVQFEVILSYTVWTMSMLIIDVLYFYLATKFSYS